MLGKLLGSVCCRLESGLVKADVRNLVCGFASRSNGSKASEGKKANRRVITKSNSKSTKELQSSERNHVQVFLDSKTETAISPLPQTSQISSNLQTFIKESIETDKHINSPLTTPKSIANPNLTLVQVEGIPNDWSMSKARTYFDPTGENIISLKPIVNRLGLPIGRVIIEFENPEKASSFIRKYDNDFIELPDFSAHLRVRLHTLSIRSESLASKIERDRTVMVYNLPFEATNKEVATVAKYYGELSRVEMPMNSRQRNKGYALLIFAEPQSANRMIEQFHGVTMHGREVKLKHGDFTFSPEDRKEVITERTAHKKPAVVKLKSDEVWEKAETPEIKIKGYLTAKHKEYISSAQTFD
jgi:RNA recognition motif. (a.k.a. RRM, RBD, or RNP domain)